MFSVFRLAAALKKNKWGLEPAEPSDPCKVFPHHLVGGPCLHTIVLQNRCQELRQQLLGVHQTMSLKAVCFSEIEKVQLAGSKLLPNSKRWHGRMGSGALSCYFQFSVLLILVTLELAVARVSLALAERSQQN